MTTISDGYDTFTPTLLEIADSERGSSNRVHQLMGGRIAVTLGHVRPRRGRLGFLLDSEALKDACVAMHQNGTIFQLTEPERPSYNMLYVLNGEGNIRVEQLREFDDLWMVSVDFQEVTE